MKISYALPQGVLSNEMLATQYGDAQWTAAKIFRKTGIQQRHIAKDELVSDLAVQAAQKLFEEHGVDRSDIDFLLLCTQSPDYLLPTTACIVQARLGLSEQTAALDYNLGCSGFVYGLALAKGLLAGGVARNVLLIMSETYTKHIHPLDRSTRTIFGDGAAATLLTEDDLSQLGEFVLGSDGRGAENLMIPAGAMACARSGQTAETQTDESGNVRSKENLYMNGPEIFAFTLRAIPELVKETLARNKLALDEINYVVFHQANRLILTTLRDTIGIAEDRFCIDVDDFGNTVSATVPIALSRAIASGVIRKGMKVLIAGFGVGYSWGAAVLHF